MLRLPCKPSRIFMDSSLRPSNLTIERSGYRWTSDRAFDQQLGRSKDLSFKSSRSSQIFFCVVNSWKNFFFLGHEATELKFKGFISSNFDQNAERENTRGWCCWYDSTSEWEYWTFPSPSPPPPLPLPLPFPSPSPFPSPPPPPPPPPPLPLYKSWYKNNKYINAIFLYFMF